MTVFSEKDQFEHIGNRMACTCGYKATSLGDVTRVRSADEFRILDCMRKMASGYSPLSLTTPRYRETFYRTEMEAFHPAYMGPINRCTDMFIDLTIELWNADPDAEELVRLEDV